MDERVFAPEVGPRADGRPLGANLTYGVWLARAARESQHLAFALRGVKILDDRIANPAYGVIFLTGMAMV